MTHTGLTLVEILVALTVLAIGAAGLAGLQLLTLRLAAATQQNVRLLHAAETELQHRILGLGSGNTCAALSAGELDGIDCSVQVQACRTEHAGFECGADLPLVGGRARQITVRVSLDSGRQVILDAVTRAAPWSGPVAAP